MIDFRYDDISCRRSVILDAKIRCVLKYLHCLYELSVTDTAAVSTAEHHAYQ